MLSIIEREICIDSETFLIKRKRLKESVAPLIGSLTMLHHVTSRFKIQMLNY